MSGRKLDTQIIGTSRLANEHPIIRTLCSEIDRLRAEIDRLRAEIERLSEGGKSSAGLLQMEVLQISRPAN